MAVSHLSQAQHNAPQTSQIDSDILIVLHHLLCNYVINENERKADNDTDAFTDTGNVAREYEVNPVPPIRETESQWIASLYTEMRARQETSSPHDL